MLDKATVLALPAFLSLAVLPALRKLPLALTVSEAYGSIDAELRQGEREEDSGERGHVRA